MSEILSIAIELNVCNQKIVTNGGSKTSESAAHSNGHSSWNYWILPRKILHVDLYWITFQTCLEKKNVQTAS